MIMLKFCLVNITFLGAIIYMKSRNFKIIILLNALSGIILILLPFVIFPVCGTLKSDGTHMSCFYSGVFISCMGFLIVIFSCLAMFKKKFFSVSFFISDFLALSCWLVPNKILNIEGIGLCANPSHACRASTMNAVLVMIIFIVILSFAALTLKFVTGDYNE